MKAEWEKEDERSVKGSVTPREDELFDVMKVERVVGSLDLCVARQERKVRTRKSTKRRQRSEYLRC
jgi:hypothetical protein